MSGFSMLWVWVMVIAVFLIAELLTGGFFMLPFAVGGAVALVSELLNAPLWLQIVVFLASSLITLFLLRPFAHKVTSQQPQTSGIDRLSGKNGIVTQTIRTTNRGRIRVDREEWNATAPDAEKDIPVGATVKVIRVDGTHVIVELIEDAAAAAAAATVGVAAAAGAAGTDDGDDDAR